MIDEKKIKSAAQGYCDATYGTLDDHPFIVEAFKEDANWGNTRIIESSRHKQIELWQQTERLESVYLRIEIRV